MKKKWTFWHILMCIGLALALVITFLPLYLMFATSTKSTFQFATNFWGIAMPPKWDNYVIAWESIGKYIINTLIVAGMEIIGVTILSVMSGYAFAKLEFKGKNFFFDFMLIFRMIPGTLILIPNFLNAYKLGLYNTFWGVVLPGLAGASFMPMLLTKGFFEGLPDDMFEAFRIDGAGEVAIITKLVMPLSRPIIITNALFTFFGAFNNYTWPLLILRDDRLKTIAIGLNSFAGQYGTDYGIQMAAYSIVTLGLMIVVAFTMKTYVNGITAGAVKG